MTLKDTLKTANDLMEALRQLENTGSTLEKKQLILKYDRGIPEFREMLVYALSPYKKYGIQRMPSGGAPHGTNGWHDIRCFLEDAARRDITGGRLVSYAFQVADNMTGPVRELFRRVLLKDLRCGVGATLVNAVIPGLIPQFSCQLAQTLQKQHIPKLQAQERVYAQPKLNGDRMIVIVPVDGGGEAFTRNGHSLNNYQELVRACETLTQRAFRVKPADGLVFDGEVIVGDFWGTRGTKKLSGNEAEGALYHIFDVVPYSEWMAAETVPFSARAKLLRALENTDHWDNSKTRRVPTMHLGPEQRSQESLDQLRDKLIQGGHEGLILRLDLGYDFSSGARSCMFKHKCMDTIDCLILKVLPGEEGKKLENTAAKLLVELPNGQECYVGMGKGLNRAALDKLWSLRGRYAGLVAEVSYQEKTVNASGEWKLQFPKFTGKIRKDKS
jgi:hypothetical protein